MGRAASPAPRTPAERTGGGTDRRSGATGRGVTPDSPGLYHRGQIAKAIGRSGGVAVNTDFITFVREAEPTG